MNKWSVRIEKRGSKIEIKMVRWYRQEEPTDKDKNENKDKDKNENKNKNKDKNKNKN